jgi:hypothetical protein
MESLPKNIEFLGNANVDVDLKEGVTVVQMALQVISTKDLVIEDSLLEKLDNTSEKKAAGGALRQAPINNDH